MAHALRNEEFTSEFYLTRVFRIMAEIFPVNKDLLLLFQRPEFYDQSPFFRQWHA